MSFPLDCPTSISFIQADSLSVISITIITILGSIFVALSCVLVVLLLILYRLPTGMDRTAFQSRASPTFHWIHSGRSKKRPIRITIQSRTEPQVMPPAPLPLNQLESGRPTLCDASVQCDEPPRSSATIQTDWTLLPKTPLQRVDSRTPESLVETLSVSELATLGIRLDDALVLLKYLDDGSQVYSLAGRHPKGNLLILHRDGSMVVQTHEGRKYRLVVPDSLKSQLPQTPSIVNQKPCSRFPDLAKPDPSEITSLSQFTSIGISLRSSLSLFSRWKDGTEVYTITDGSEPIPNARLFVYANGKVEVDSRHHGVFKVAQSLLRVPPLQLSAIKDFTFLHGVCKKVPSQQRLHPQLQLARCHSVSVEQIQKPQTLTVNHGTNEHQVRSRVVSNLKPVVRKLKTQNSSSLKQCSWCGRYRHEITNCKRFTEDTSAGRIVGWTDFITGEFKVYDYRLTSEEVGKQIHLDGDIPPGGFRSLLRR